MTPVIPPLPGLPPAPVPSGKPRGEAGAARPGGPGRGLDISETIAAAVLAVPAVAHLHGGSFGQVATYLPGRSVIGVRIRPDVTDIHVVLFWGAPVLAAAEQVRAVVLPWVEGLSARVDVTVDDVIDPALGTESVSGPGRAAGGPRPATL